MPLPPPVSAAARQTIRAAYDDLDRTITPADSRDFRATTITSVRDAALEIERQLAARGSLRNMRRLMPLFRGIEHYSKVMDILCNGTPYLPWIWAPIALILRVASEHVEAFEQIIKGYAQLAEALGRFEILDNAFKDDHDFQQVLAVFYADILQFHKHAYKFVRRSGWRLLFLTSWGRFQRRFDGIIEDMGRHSDLIDKEANARNISEAQEMRRDLRAWRQDNIDKVKSFEDEQAIKQYQSIIAWMNIDESDQLAIFDSIMAEGRNYPGTCAWILKNPKVSSWLQKRPESPILWLQGTPGSGKSVISTQLVNFMQTAKMFVMYHFCTYLYMSSTMYEQILRSLLMQLLRKDGDLVTHVYEEFVLGKKSPTIAALERLLQLLFKSVSDEPSQTEYFWIILDGLDECEPDKQARVISLMNQVTSHRSLSGNAVCKVLISSRSSTTLSHWLRKKQIVSFSEEKYCLEGAIRLYAAQRLQALEHRFHQLDIAPGELDDIERQIAKRADGMFLYARLVLDYLSTNVFYSCDEIKASVNQLPEKINDFYHKILTQVLIHLDSRSVNRIKCVLGWIAFAKRPLKRLEFLSAVTFSAGDPNIAHLCPQYILDICAPLIDERHDTTVTFIHVSVKEFLQTASCSVMIDEQEALEEHGVAAVTCLLSGSEVFYTAYDKQTAYHRVVKGLHGFHVYATEYWTEYLLSRAEYVSVLENNSLLFAMACQMADKLDEIAGLLAKEQFQTQSSVQDENAQDKRLAYLQQYPILQKQVRAALDARSIKQLEYELLQTPAHDGIPRASQASPTLCRISDMLAVYQETVRSILDQSDHPGISSEELGLFKSQFRASAYTCRLKSCPRATLGFETDKARLDHEIAHVRKFRCTFPDCHFPPFLSAQALKGHTNKYHNPNPAPKSIRNTQTPLPPKRYLTRHDDEDDQSLQKRRKDSLLWLSTYSNISQPEENEQALNKRADRSLLRDLPTHLPLSGHQPVHEMKSWNQSGAAKILSDEATEQTKSPLPATRHDSLVPPSLKRRFSPEPWLHPYMPQMGSRMDKWDREREKNGEFKLKSDRLIHTNEMLLHHETQGSQQKQADVGSWHDKMYDSKRLAHVADAHTPSSRKTSNDIGDEQIQLPSISDVLLRQDDAQKRQTIRRSSSDGLGERYRPSQHRGAISINTPVIEISDDDSDELSDANLDEAADGLGERYRPSQHRGAVSINTPVIEISDDDSDEISDADSNETADDDWGRDLNMNLYRIIINLMELPANFPHEELGIPPTLERWETFWPWMRRHPEFSMHLMSLVDIQHLQFKQRLLKEAGFSSDQEMKPAFGVSNLESERVRNDTRWYGQSDYGILKAVVNTKRAIWKRMKNGTDGELFLPKYMIP